MDFEVSFKPLLVLLHALFCDKKLAARIRDDETRLVLAAHIRSETPAHAQETKNGHAILAPNR